MGQPTPEFTVDALTTVNEDSRLGLKLVGSATIEGTATNETIVVTPSREIDLTVPLTIPQSPIPDETGEFTVPAQALPRPSPSPRMMLARRSSASVALHST